MNRLFLILSLVSSAFVAHAANPTLENFDQVHFRTNGPTALKMIQTRLSSSNFDQSGDTWTITNIGSASLWTNIAGILQPRVGTGVLVTNMDVAERLGVLGALIFETPLVTNLVVGMNDLNVLGVSRVQLTGPTADPADTGINLNSGSGPGSLLILENFSNGFGFTLTNATPMWGSAPGSEILLTQGETWAPTAEGESMWLMQNNHGDWVEVSRQLPGSAGPGTINPTDDYLPVRTGASSFGDSYIHHGSGDSLVIFTNGVTFTHGGMTLGSNTSNYWTYLPTQGELVSFNDVSLGDPNGFALFFGVGQTTAAMDRSNFTVEGSTAQLALSVLHLDGAGAGNGWLLSAQDDISTFSQVLSGATRVILAANNNYSGAGTLFLSDDGTYKAISGGDTIFNDVTITNLTVENNFTLKGNGTVIISNVTYSLIPVWTNNAGVIEPLGSGQLTNVLRFTSGMADNATNVAMVVDTTVPWSDGRLTSWRNNSRELATVLANGTFYSLYDTSTNTSSAQMYAAFRSPTIALQLSEQTNTSNRYEISWSMSDGAPPYHLMIDNSLDDPYLVVFDPENVEGFTDAPFHLNTGVTISTGLLFQLQNAGTNKFTVAYDGAIAASGQATFPSAIITNNIAAVLSVGDTTFVDVSKASQTNSVTGAFVLAHATNGVHGLQVTHLRMLSNSSGSDQTLTFPIIASGVNGWSTNQLTGAIPPVITNNTSIYVMLRCSGPTDTLARQTNVTVLGFEYYP